MFCSLALTVVAWMCSLWDNELRCFWPYAHFNKWSLMNTKKNLIKLKLSDFLKKNLGMTFTYWLWLEILVNILKNMWSSRDVGLIFTPLPYLLTEECLLAWDFSVKNSSWTHPGHWWLESSSPGIILVTVKSLGFGAHVHSAWESTETPLKEVIILSAQLVILVNGIRAS